MIILATELSRSTALDMAQGSPGGVEEFVGLGSVARDTASELGQSRRFTATAFGLAALAALAFAAIVNNGADLVALPEEARNVIAWSFVGLAAFDAVMLIVWGRFVAWLADAQSR